MNRLLAAGLMVLVCGALGACGEKDDSAAVPKGDAGTRSGLGVKRFQALDAVYVAGVPLDKYQNQEDYSFEAFAKDAKPLQKACDALPSDDALMRGLRKSCPIITEFFETGAEFAKCDSTATCLRGTRGFRRFLKRFLAVSRTADRAIAAEKGLEAECKKALAAPPKLYPIFEDYDSAMGLLERALRSPSPAALQKAQSRIAAVDKRSRALPTGKAMLARFRSDCD